MAWRTSCCSSGPPAALSSARRFCPAAPERTTDTERTVSILLGSEVLPGQTGTGPTLHWRWDSLSSSQNRSSWLRPALAGSKPPSCQNIQSRAVSGAGPAVLIRSQQRHRLIKNSSGDSEQKPDPTRIHQHPAWITWTGSALQDGEETRTGLARFWSPCVAAAGPNPSAASEQNHLLPSTLTARRRAPAAGAASPGAQNQQNRVRTRSRPAEPGQNQNGPVQRHPAPPEAPPPSPAAAAAPAAACCALARPAAAAPRSPAPPAAAVLQLGA